MKLCSAHNRFCAKFAKVPAKPDNLHRALNAEPNRLAEVLCWRENRYAGKQLTTSYDRKRIMLEENELSRAGCKYADTYAFADGRFEVRLKGHSLPYRVIDMNPARHPCCRRREQAAECGSGAYQRDA